MECEANQCGVTRCKEVIGLVKNGQEELNLILYKPDENYAEIVVNYGKTFKTMATQQKKQEWYDEYLRARAEDFGEQ